MYNFSDFHMKNIEKIVDKSLLFLSASFKRLEVYNFPDSLYIALLDLFFDGVCGPRSENPSPYLRAVRRTI